MIVQTLANLFLCRSIIIDSIGGNVMGLANQSRLSLELFEGP